jgi:2-amino-4-hydroxy-6-hydroxymethyldihydropteridine diphosphokinase
MNQHCAYVGIGTNLGDRLANVERAMGKLATLGTIRRRSSLYRSEPWGKADQPWFLNAVVALETDLSPVALLERVHAIEEAMGRTRGERWGPRIVDLDLLLYDDLEIDTAELRVPHPHLRERAFVLIPLAEIDRRFESLRDGLHAAQRAGVVRVERENVAEMPQESTLTASERVRALARFLADGEVVRVRIRRADEDIEVSAMPHRMRLPLRAETNARPRPAAARVDTIKADLVGIFHLSRPAPLEGDVFEGDRELGYIEALGIRTPVRTMGAGRIVSVAIADGTPVEYGQPLFLIARGT